MTTDRIPAFYRFIFLWFNPVCSGWGAYICLFAPATVLEAYNPAAKYTQTYDVLFQQLAGPYLMLSFLDIFLLRYTKDLTIWKIYHFSVTIVDVLILYSFYDVLKLQGRLPFGLWVTADWVNIGITLFAGVTRLAFIAELGFPSRQAGRVKSS